MQKPNVLHVVNNLNVSGASVLLLDLARHLQSEGDRLSVCTIEAENPLADALRATGATVYQPEHKLGLTSGVRFVRQAIKTAEPDIVHTHLLPATQVGLAAAKAAGVPAVTTVHFTFERFKANAVLQKLSHLSFRFYKRIFAISEAVKQSMLACCPVPEDRVRVLPNAIDISRVPDLTPELRAGARRRFSLQPGEFVFGFIGRLQAVKGVHLLLEAFARMLAAHPEHRMKLLIVGDGPERRSLEIRKDELGLGDSTIFTGTQKASALLAAFDAFVMPSLSEGFGLSIIEAMAAGMPVIGSTAGGIPEVIDHNKTGLLFESGDCTALREQMERLLYDRELGAQLAAAGRQSAIRTFNMYSYSQKLYASYEELLRKRQPQLITF